VPPGGRRRKNTNIYVHRSVRQKVVKRGPLVGRRGFFMELKKNVKVGEDSGYTAESQGDRDLRGCLVRQRAKRIAYENPWNRFGKDNPTCLSSNIVPPNGNPMVRRS